MPIDKTAKGSEFLQDSNPMMLHTWGIATRNLTPNEIMLLILALRQWVLAHTEDEDMVVALGGQEEI